MNKLSGADLCDLLEKGAAALTSVISERDMWKTAAEKYMRRDEAEKVASAMHEKGIRSEVPYAELVAEMEKAAELGTLEKIADAVELAGPNMGEKIGQLAGGYRGQSPSSSAEESDFTRFIQGTI